jgi:hypothetical protein
MSFDPPTTPPRNRLGAVTFAVVLIGALLAVIPAMAPLGFLLCLVAIVPAIFAHRRVRKGRATNRRRSLGAVIAAPVFVVVAMVVGAATAPPPVAGGAVPLAAGNEVAGMPGPAVPAAAAQAPMVAAPVVPQSGIDAAAPAWWIRERSTRSSSLSAMSGPARRSG